MTKAVARPRLGQHVLQRAADGHDLLARGLEAQAPELAHDVSSPWRPSLVTKATPCPPRAARRSPRPRPASARRRPRRSRRGRAGWGRSGESGARGTAGRPLSSPPCRLDPARPAVLVACARRAAAATTRRRRPRASRDARAGSRARRSRRPAPKGEQNLSRPTTTLAPGQRYAVDLQTNCGDDHDPPRPPAARRRPTASFADLVKQRLLRRPHLPPHRRPASSSRAATRSATARAAPATRSSRAAAEARATRPGIVAMAKTETDPPGTSGSQFFIVTGAQRRRCRPTTRSSAACVRGMDAAQAHREGPGRRPGPPELAGRHPEGEALRTG